MSYFGYRRGLTGDKEGAQSGTSILRQSGKKVIGLAKKIAVLNTF